MLTASNPNADLPTVTNSMLNKKKALKRIFDKKFVGFRFATLDEDQSLLGMLYHSRVPISESNPLFDNDDGNIHFNIAEMTSDMGSSFSMGSEDSDGEEMDDQNRDLNPRQQLALTVKNWSRTPENDRNILEEGAVHALIALTTTDDSLIKKWCAIALYNLSTRASNRKELLSLGAAGGIIAVANNARNWKSAKLCAMTLCNLSIEPGGEEVLLGEHAQLSLVSFLAVRGHFLLPICSQALYNLTQVSRYSTSLERVIKALLNIPTLPGFYDPTAILLKSIVNCTRFPELHVRILEDSCLPTFLNALRAIPNKTPEIALQVCTFIRSLSETEKRRMDLILRGHVTLLAEYSAACDTEGRRQLICAMSNIVDCPLVFPPKTVITHLSVMVDICTHCIRISDDACVLQHGAYCLHMLTKVQVIEPQTKFWPWSGLDSTADIVDCISKCLQFQEDGPKHLTQYFAVLTCNNIFFSDSCFFKFDKCEELVRILLSSIASMKDEQCIDIMAATVAQLTRSALYMDVILRQRSIMSVLDSMMNLLESYRDALHIQESCCIAIVSICGNSSITFDQDRRGEISRVFFYLSQSKEPTLLYSILSGILVLADRGVTEMLSLETLQRVTEIAQVYSTLHDLTQICCAIFRLYSYNKDFCDSLCTDAVLDFLFAKASCEDSISAVIAAIVLCNLTIHQEATTKIIRRGLVQLLPSLACSDTALQDIYVRCMCNISSFPESRELMLREDIPQTILMIALVQSVSVVTKQLCLRVLLNMLDDSSIAYYVRSNVVRAFSGLATVADSLVQAQCAKGFLVMTSTQEGRKEIAMRKTVLMALFGLIQSPDIPTKNMVGIAIYNMLSCEYCWESLTSSGAISLVKVLVTSDSGILREASAQILVTLIRRPALHPILVREPLLQMMVEVLQHPAAFAFEAAICALAYLSHFPIFRVPMIDNHCATILLAALMSGNINNKHIAEEVIRCMYLLSFEKEHAAKLIEKSHVMLSMHVINRYRICSPRIARMMTFILRNLSYISASRETLVEEDALSLQLHLLEQYSNSKAVIFSALSHFLHNLSKESYLHEKLMSGKVMDVVRMMVPSESELSASSKLSNDPEDVLRICATVNLLSCTTSCHGTILDGGAINTFSILLQSLPESAVSAAIENEIANCICNITSTPACRELLNRHGATKLLLQLSNRSAIPETQKYCSVALARLSENNHVDEGVVASLLLLSLKMDERDAASLQVSDSYSTQVSPNRQRGSLTSSQYSGKPEKARDTFHDSIRLGLVNSAEKHGVDLSPKKASPYRGSVARAVLLDESIKETAEKDEYVGRYDAYFFKHVASTTWVEVGGLCQLQKLQLSEPTLSASNNIVQMERKEDLLQIPMSSHPLPKESRNAELPHFNEGQDGSLVETSIDSSNADKGNVVYEMM